MKIDTIINTEHSTLDDPDGFYNELVALHRGLSEQESAVVNWRLILLLANQVGTRKARAAIHAARLK